MVKEPAKSNGATHDDSEFDKFADLARKLVAVPKHEVDDERAKADAAKG